MITSIISFVVGEKSFVSNFNKTPILLAAQDYLNFSVTESIEYPFTFKFESSIVDLYDIAGRLGQKNAKLTRDSKILVGDFEGFSRGFLVDKVLEIINLDNEHNLLTGENNNIFKIDDIEYQFIDVNDFLSEKVK